MGQSEAHGHKVSYCTTCKGRLHHLKETLPANLAAEAHNPNVEFVVLDYGSEDGLGEWIHQNFQAEIESGRLRYARSEQPFFRMAHAKNMAHRLATGDILCNVDADNFVPKDFSRWLGEQFDQDPHAIITPLALTQGEFVKQRTARVLKGQTPKLSGIGGRVAVSSEDFYKLGGYDERIEGWGPDDLQFCLRARDAGLTPVRLPPEQVGHVISHDTESRLKELSPDARVNSERLINRSGPLKMAAAMKRLGTRYEMVANNGEPGCGDVTINFNYEHSISSAATPKPAAEAAPVRKTDWRHTAKRPDPGVELS